MKHFKEPIFIDIKQPFIILIDEQSPFLYQLQCDHLYCQQKTIRGYFLPLPYSLALDSCCFEYITKGQAACLKDYLLTIISDCPDIFTSLTLTEDMIIREAFVYIDIEFKEKPDAIFKGVLSWENCD